MAKKSEAGAKKAPTKSELMASIADATGLSKKDVSAVFDAISNEVTKQMSNRGTGLFVLPGLLKIERRRIPAQPAKKNWKNPFTGEIGTKPAKPASNKIKIRALKMLKETVAKS